MFKLINYLIICSVFHSGFTSDPTFPLFKYDDRERLRNFFKKSDSELGNDTKGVFAAPMNAAKPATESLIYYPLVETYYPPEYFPQEAFYPLIDSYNYQYPLPYLVRVEPYIIPAPVDVVSEKPLVSSTNAVPPPEKIEHPSPNTLDGMEINLTDKDRDELTAKIIKIIKDHVTNASETNINDEYKGEAGENENLNVNISSTWSDDTNTTIELRLENTTFAMEPQTTPAVADNSDLKMFNDEQKANFFENNFEKPNTLQYVDKDGQICKEQIIKVENKTYKLIECKFDRGTGQADESSATQATEEAIENAAVRNEDDDDYGPGSDIYDKDTAEKY